jgi:hypothetical protein
MDHSIKRHEKWSNLNNRDEITDSNDVRNGASLSSAAVDFMGLRNGIPLPFPDLVLVRLMGCSRSPSPPSPLTPLPPPPPLLLSTLLSAVGKWDMYLRVFVLFLFFVLFAIKVK